MLQQHQRNLSHSDESAEGGTRPPPPAAFEYETCEVVEHRSFLPHRGHITSIICDGSKFITGSRDKTVSVNYFTSGRSNRR